jgi:hypothetical protein
MRWINSAGGPLVLVPATKVAQWRGIRDGGGDYAAACAVDDDVGVIRWNGVDVLVLADEPLATACIAGELTVFLRWSYAPNEGAIENVVRGMMLELSEPRSRVSFDCQTTRHVLFDAGAPGSSVDEAIELGITPGGYVSSMSTAG